MITTARLFLMFAGMALLVSGFVSTSKAQNAKAAGPVAYSVLNDDEPIGETGHFNSASVFVNGVYKTKISTGSYGIGGGYLGLPSVDIDIQNGQNQCVFVSDGGGVSGSGPGDIFAYNVATNSGTRVESGLGFNGSIYGIGLAHHGNVLVAAWGGSNAIETFTIGAGCSLTSTETSATGLGLEGGTADGLAIAPNGKYLTATYDDGSYGVYSLTAATLGAPLQYNSNCSENVTLFGVPIAVAISPDSSTVYLDCLIPGNGAVVDAFKISDPSHTVTNGPLTAAGGTPINGSITMSLSADGKVLYLVGTFSGSLESANVSGTSVTANGCSNLLLPGYNSQWIYPGSINVMGAGAGKGFAVPETAFGHTPDSYLEMVTIDANHCLTAVKQGTDANSLHALSGASYLLR